MCEVNGEKLAYRKEKQDQKQDQRIIKELEMDTSGTKQLLDAVNDKRKYTSEELKKRKLSLDSDRMC